MASGQRPRGIRGSRLNRGRRSRMLNYTVANDADRWFPRTRRVFVVQSGADQRRWNSTRLPSSKWFAGKPLNDRLGKMYTYSEVRTALFVRAAAWLLVSLAMLAAAMPT